MKASGRLYLDDSALRLCGSATLSVPVRVHALSLGRLKSTHCAKPPASSRSSSQRRQHPHAASSTSTALAVSYHQPRCHSSRHHHLSQSLADRQQDTEASADYSTFLPTSSHRPPRLNHPGRSPRWFVHIRPEHGSTHLWGHSSMLIQSTTGSKPVGHGRCRRRQGRQRQEGS